ncbi:MAG TPA: polysaccharide deacetylase family protein [Spirochaetia bacterium]|nr:polysaccharide deacetylase family protein [Spirochaetia bacterium]
MTQRRRIICILITLFLSGVTLEAEIHFSAPSLFAPTTLLFKAETSLPGHDAYETLFLTDIVTRKTTQLTFFPEHLCFLADRGILQIQNRFGVFRSDGSLKTFTPLSLFPAFVNGAEISQGKITPIVTSPDGRFLVYFRPTSGAFGKLMLYDLSREQETVVSENMPLTLDTPPVLWSPNAKLFVYGKAGRLYYFSIDHLEKNRSLAENYRNIAPGGITSVCWDSFSNLYYADQTLILRIESTELYTRALYSGSIEIGTIVGKMPFAFQPGLDRFWVSPDGTKLILNKGQQNVFFFYLVHADYTQESMVTSLPHLYLPRSISLKKVLWSAADTVTLLADGMEKGTRVSSLFRLQVMPDKSVRGFNRLEETNVRDLVLSPDGSKVLVIRDDRIDIFSYGKWTKETGIPFLTPVTALWKSDSELVIGGARTVELYDISRKAFSFLTLSQPGEAGFSTDGTTVITRNGSATYATALTQAEWRSVSGAATAAATVATEAYRVYVEDIERGNYANMIMVRNLEELVTAPLFPYTTYAYEEFPNKEEAIDTTYFNHGSRVRRREVAIVLNAIDSTEGLSTILTVLKEYNITCTFFVNGEFIRRFPDAAKEIAESGHEVGSLFYAYFDMTDARYTVDTDFIKKGLARNEDEYFRATGKELALLWHAPYYFINSSIIEASKEMNYSYVGRDVDSLDWVGKASPTQGPEGYLAAVKLIERILELKKPGSIISIRVGIPENERDDYLFQYFDVLVNALIRLGYDIVPISTLMEHAK